MLTDTHSHLDDPVFAPDLAEVIARAALAGVERIITIGTSLESSRRALELAGQYPNVYAVIGIHPNEAEEAPEDVMAQLRALAAHPKVVALGEMGLDYHYLPSRELLNPVPAYIAEMPLNDPRSIEASIRDGACKAAQAVLFEEQLELAEALGLNVVIHQREAWEDTLAILRPYAGRLRAVFHCFGESPERAEMLYAMGHLVSFTGLVTFKNAARVRETARVAPKDRFMVETDCPYLAPTPHRGKRCEPGYTRLVAEALALERGETLAEIARATEANANGFFRFRSEAE